MEHLSQGVDIAITGMLVVYAALSLITAAIAVLPRILAALEPWIGPERERHAPVAVAVAAEEDDEALLVAIGFVLAHEHRQREES